MVEASSGRAAGQRKYRLFGLTLTSDFDFESRLAPGRGAADLTFASSAHAPFVARLGEPAYESPLVDESGDSLARLYRLPAGELLRFGDALDFYLGEKRIDCHLRDPRAAALVEIRLLGPVLAYWLERLTICVLHASAVVVEGRAVAFMAMNQGGKSAHAATLMTDGMPLLTDDLLPVEPRGGTFVARAGYPQMRLRPDGLAHFVNDRRRREAARARLGKHWVPVGPDGFGAFHSAVASLGCIYLPERRRRESASSEVRITALPPRQALIELLRRSFSPYIVEAVGLQPRRLQLFSQLLRQVPLRRLIYPSGLDALPGVCEAVLGDLQTL